MKAKSILLVGLWGALLFPPNSNSCEAQDLTRTNNIVNQALQLANSARATASQPMGVAIAPRAQTLTNPFSVNGEVVVQPAIVSAPTFRGAGVEVTGNAVHVDIGGETLTVPRIASSAPVPVQTSTTVSNAMNTAQNWVEFADAVRMFRSSNFDGAVAKMNAANTSGQHAAFAPFHSLCHFAEGDYNRAAKFAYSSLANQQPLYNWRQIKTYYAAPVNYQKHYETLQAAAAGKGSNVSTQFLVGYHHLMLGHREHAVRSFEQVQTQLPGDPIIEYVLSISRDIPPAPVSR